MLQHLHIQNYALIRHLDIDFESGFSAISGETGAGKSIILGALALVMGGKADPKTIADGEEHCIIEADFGDYLIRRELHANGRSRSLINDEVASQSDLKQLAAKLIDIHSQHASLLLEDSAFQLSVVDALAHNCEQREAYGKAYMQWQKEVSDLQRLQDLADATRQDEDYIRFQCTQLNEACLNDPNEIEQLEQEEYRLSHIEDYRQQLTFVIQALDNDEDSTLVRVHDAMRSAEAFPELGQRLQLLEIELKDILSEVRSKVDAIEYNPERLAIVQERLTMLQMLLRKHQKQTLQDLIDYYHQLEEQLQNITSFDENIEEQQRVVNSAYQVVKQHAERLTQSRQSILSDIAQQLQRGLAQLGIQHANVRIDLLPLTNYSSSGADEVQILFAANLNQVLRPIRDIASGGEMSRFMLCVKALIASQNGLPTIIFDEIDTGVSGEIATQMGRILRQMGQSRQIISITHLPQIAAQASAHYRVYKEDTDTYTETHITRLNAEERVQEIASMLAGKRISTATLQTAQQLLNNIDTL